MEHSEQLTLTAWNLLAGNFGIVPSVDDLRQLLLLRVELVRYNSHPRDCFVIRKTPEPDLEFPAFDLCFRSGPDRSACVIATCWIENAGSPDAYFYWES